MRIVGGYAEGECNRLRPDPRGDLESGRVNQGRQCSPEGAALGVRYRCVRAVDS